MDDQPSPRRRFQVRLRTLLIVVTLLAVLAAVVTWVIRDRQRLIRERDRAQAAEKQALIDRQNAISEKVFLEARLTAVKTALAKSAAATHP